MDVLHRRQNQNQRRHVATVLSEDESGVETVFTEDDCSYESSDLGSFSDGSMDLVERLGYPGLQQLLDKYVHPDSGNDRKATGGNDGLLDFMLGRKCTSEDESTLFSPDAAGRRQTPVSMANRSISLLHSYSTESPNSFANNRRKHNKRHQFANTMLRSFDPIDAFCTGSDQSPRPHVAWSVQNSFKNKVNLLPAKSGRGYTESLMAQTDYSLEENEIVFDDARDDDVSNTRGLFDGLFLWETPPPPEDVMLSPLIEARKGRKEFSKAASGEAREKKRKSTATEREGPPPSSNVAESSHETFERITLLPGNQESNQDLQPAGLLPHTKTKLHVFSDSPPRSGGKPPLAPKRSVTNHTPIYSVRRQFSKGGGLKKKIGGSRRKKRTVKIPTDSPRSVTPLSLGMAAGKEDLSGLPIPPPPPPPPPPLSRRSAHSNDYSKSSKNSTMVLIGTTPPPPPPPPPPTSPPKLTPLRTKTQSLFNSSHSFSPNSTQEAVETEPEVEVRVPEVLPLSPLNKVSDNEASLIHSAEDTPVKKTLTRLQQMKKVKRFFQDRIRHVRSEQVGDEEEVEIVCEDLTAQERAESPLFSRPFSPCKLSSMGFSTSRSKSFEEELVAVGKASVKVDEVESREATGPKNTIDSKPDLSASDKLEDQHFMKPRLPWSPKRLLAVGSLYDSEGNKVFALSPRHNQVGESMVYSPQKGNKTPKGKAALLKGFGYKSSRETGANGKAEGGMQPAPPEPSIGASIQARRKFAMGDLGLSRRSVFHHAKQEPVECDKQPVVEEREQDDIPEKRCHPPKWLLSPRNKNFTFNDKLQETGCDASIPQEKQPISPRRLISPLGLFQNRAEKVTATAGTNDELSELQGGETAAALQARAKFESQLLSRLRLLSASKEKSVELRRTRPIEKGLGTIPELEPAPSYDNFIKPVCSEDEIRLNNALLKAEAKRRVLKHDAEMSSLTSRSTYTSLPNSTTQKSSQRSPSEQISLTSASNQDMKSKSAITYGNSASETLANNHLDMYHCLDCFPCKSGVHSPDHKPKEISVIPHPLALPSVDERCAKRSKIKADVSGEELSEGSTGVEVSKKTHKRLRFAVGKKFAALHQPISSLIRAQAQKFHASEQKMQKIPDDLEGTESLNPESCYESTKPWINSKENLTSSNLMTSSGDGNATESHFEHKDVPNTASFEGDTATSDSSNAKAAIVGFHHFAHGFCGSDSTRKLPLSLSDEKKPLAVATNESDAVSSGKPPDVASQSTTITSRPRQNDLSPHDGSSRESGDRKSDPNKEDGTDDFEKNNAQNLKLASFDSDSKTMSKSLLPAVAEEAEYEEGLSNHSSQKCIETNRQDVVVESANNVSNVGDRISDFKGKVLAAGGRAWGRRHALLNRQRVKKCSQKANEQEEATEATSCTHGTPPLPPPSTDSEPNRGSRFRSKYNKARIPMVLPGSKSQSRKPEVDDFRQTKSSADSTVSTTDSSIATNEGLLQLFALGEDGFKEEVLKRSSRKSSQTIETGTSTKTKKATNRALSLEDPNDETHKLLRKIEEKLAQRLDYDLTLLKLVQKKKDRLRKRRRRLGQPASQKHYDLASPEPTDLGLNCLAELHQTRSAEWIPLSPNALMETFTCGPSKSFRQ